MKLVNFLMKMQNEVVQVELKNGAIVQGTILSVSPTMNINLKDVKMTVVNRQATVLEHMTIRGNQVRMVLLPDELNIDSILQDAVFKPKKSKKQPQVDVSNTNRAPKRISRAKNRGF
jgi:small nuclear ribonucleoprotein D1